MLLVRPWAEGGGLDTWALYIVLIDTCVSCVLHLVFVGIVLITMRGCERMIVDPRIPTILGRRTSGFANHADNTCALILCLVLEISTFLFAATTSGYCH